MPMIPKPAINELTFEIAKLRGINPEHGEVPEPDIDPVNCIELLKYLMHHDTTFHVEIGGDGESHCWCQISVLDDKMNMQQLPIVYSETLELAIATAARDALKSLRGDE